jgi:hypothetical protein
MVNIFYPQTQWCTCSYLHVSVVAVVVAEVVDGGIVLVVVAAVAEGVQEMFIL